MKDDLRDRLAAAEDELRRRFVDCPDIELLMTSRFGFDFLSEEGVDAELLDPLPADRVGGLQRTPGPGHGQLGLWSIAGRRVLAHEWETVPGEEVHPAEEAFMVWIAGRLAIPNVIHVCAAQTLIPEIEIPSVQLVADHICWGVADPLGGWSSQREGARFPQLEEAYDEGLRRSAGRALAGSEEGRVALVRPGPAGPTRAERECFRRLGAELLVEGVASEAVAARHCLRRFAALAVVLDSHDESPPPDPGVLAARAEQALPELARTLESMARALEPAT